MRSKTLHDVFRRLADTFAERSPRAESSTGHDDATASSVPIGGHLSTDAFDARLSDAVLRRRPNTAGKFQVVRLDRISDAFGGRWPVIQDRVMQIAQRVLQKRLTRADCYSRADDKSFLVLFVELTEEQARFKADSIAEEIRSLVLGEVDNGSDVGVRTGVADIERLALSESVTGETLSRVLEHEMVADNSTAEIARRAPLDDVDIAYRPTLNVRAGYVATFDCVPSRRNGGRVYRGPSFYPGGSGELTLRMNLEVICRVLIDVHQAIATGCKFSAILPIHVQAIASRHRHDLIDVLKAIDQDTRRTLILDLVGCLPGTPSIRLGEIISALSPFGRAVTMRVNVDYPHVDALQNLGLMALGTDLGDRAVDGTTANLLTAFVRRVRAIRLHPCVFGLHSAEMVATLAELGVDYINGPAIAPASQMIRALEPYSRPLSAARPIKDLVSPSGITPVR